MNPNLKPLTSIPFLAALFLLLVNDFFLKEIFANGLTGKLSDFSGLFAFCVFWISFFPKHRALVCWSVALLFVWWKSTWSQPFIEGWNTIMPIGINRVVDYTDVFALAILPLAYYGGSNHKLPVFRIHPLFPIFIASFAFAATSYHTDVEVAQVYEFPFSEDTLARKIEMLDSVENGQLFLEQLYEVDSSGNFYVHKYVNSAKVIDIGDTLNYLSDTTELYILEDFCFDGYDAQIVVSGNRSISYIKLLQFHHGCPAESTDQEVLIKSFERIVIDKLKK